MKVIYLFRLLCVLIILTLFSPPDFLFAQQLSFSEVLTNVSNYGCTVHSMTSSYDNGFMLAGETSGYGLIAKIDSAGNYIWGKNIGARWFDIVQTKDSAFMLAGVDEYGSTSCMKVSKTADTMWFKTLSGNDVYRVQQTFDGGYVMTGYKGFGVAPYSMVSIIKLDSAGNLEWSKYYAAGNNSNYGKSIRQTSDSGYIVTGSIEDYPPYQAGAFILRLNSAGDILWAKKYYLPFLYQHPTGNDILTMHNGFLLYLDNNGNFYLVRTDFEGNILWSKEYMYFGSGPGSLNERASRINRTTDSCFVFLHGSCWGSALIKVDFHGNLVFAKQLDIASVEMVETQDRGLLIAGNGPMCGVKMNEAHDPQIGIIKTDSLGNAPMCVWENLTNQPLNSTLLVDSATFTSFPGSTLIFSQPGISSVQLLSEEGCVAHNSGIYTQHSLDSIIVFPNPVISDVYIKSIEAIDGFQLQSVSGINLLNEVTNSSNLEIDMSRFPDGVYFLRLSRNGQSYYTKIIKQ